MFIETMVEHSGITSISDSMVLILKTWGTSSGVVLKCHHMIHGCQGIMSYLSCDTQSRQKVKAVFSDRNYSGTNNWTRLEVSLMFN